MRVISKSRLREFWERTERGDAEGPLRAWHTRVSSRTVVWHSWGDVKSEIGSASLVGRCVVFNVGGNKYRLVTRILDASQKVLILKVMTHGEYDDDRWKIECGCFEPSSQSKPTKRMGSQKRKGR
ncbi:type II toxin-antitoxin system HigB family toxin [Candidatus Laterigemmans baculatus]|uniref:type II toxin-antitoxin system HigB family toxin n=1 Tax=Candidatus Laterigemmans baculatus TaxID=2770505 RepID=UPI0013DAF564